MLTTEDIKKYNNCIKILKTKQPKEKWSDDLNMQINFIKRHTDLKLKFYPEEWFESNVKRTVSIYSKSYAIYSKKYNYDNVKFKKAQKTVLELEKKINEHMYVSQKK